MEQSSGLQTVLWDPIAGALLQTGFYHTPKMNIIPRNIRVSEKTRYNLYGSDVYTLALAKAVMTPNSHNPVLQPCVSHLGSLQASSIMSTSGFTGIRVHAQKLIARAHAFMLMPTTLLNHCLSVSTRETIAMGTLKIVQTCRHFVQVSHVGGIRAQGTVTMCGTDMV